MQEQRSKTVPLQPSGSPSAAREEARPGPVPHTADEPIPFRTGSISGTAQHGEAPVPATVQTRLRAAPALCALGPAAPAPCARPPPREVLGPPACRAAAAVGWLLSGGGGGGGSGEGEPAGRRCEGRPSSAVGVEVRDTKSFWRLKSPFQT